MTLAYLIELASHAAALDEYVTLEEYEDIKDFAKTWRELAGVDLEDLAIRRVIDRDLLENITDINGITE